jgi:hypothetical protein
MLERDYAGAERLLADFPLEEFPAPVPGIKYIFFALTAWAKVISPRPASYLSRCEGTGNPWFGNIRIRRRSLGSVCFMPTSAARRMHCDESRRAVDLVPENDAIERPAYSANLALVYALRGESEKAVTLIEQLLTKPAMEIEGVPAMTLMNLRSWRWDSTTKQSAFPEILAGPEPKTVY